MKEATLKVSSDEFLARHCVILKGTKDTGYDNEWQSLVFNASSKSNADCIAMADMFGVKTVIVRKKSK